MKIIKAISNLKNKYFNEAKITKFIDKYRVIEVSFYTGISINAILFYRYLKKRMVLDQLEEYAKSKKYQTN